jgi:hypothetical protein
LVKSFALAPAHYVAALCLLGAGVALVAGRRGSGAAMIRQ